MVGNSVVHLAYGLALLRENGRYYLITPTKLPMQKRGQFEHDELIEKYRDELDPRSSRAEIEEFLYGSGKEPRGTKTLRKKILARFGMSKNPEDRRLAPTVRIVRATIRPPADDPRNRTTQRMTAVKVGVAKSNPACLKMSKAVWKRLHRTDKRISRKKRYVRCAHRNAPGRTCWVMVQLPK